MMGRLLYLSLVPGLLISVSVHAQSADNALKYNGDMLVRGFYTSRDLPLERVTKEPCPNPAEAGRAGAVQSPCREAKDYYTARFRLNLIFTPNSNAELYYGIEVGDIIFGQDRPNKMGPGSGGRGSDAVNLETREMRLRFHNDDRTVHFDSGVFPVGSPAGLVLATSGAGFRLEGEARSLYSSFQLVYLRQSDDSIKDGDQNGYNDTTFKDVNLLYGNWRFFGLQDWNFDSYTIYRRDPAEYDDSGNLRDTSQLYWVGSQVRYTKGGFSFMVHGAANAGIVSSTTDRETSGANNRFYQPSITNDGNILWTATDSVNLRKSSSVFESERLTLIEEARKSYPASRRRYPVRSGAGQFEVSYRIADGTTLALSGAGAGGRLSAETDGTTQAYRTDRFYTAGSAFQFTEIALDTSGGYTIFRNGELTGLRAYKLEWKQKFTAAIEGRTSYTHIHSAYRLDGSFNQFYGWWKGSPSGDIGNEWNVIVDWRPLAQFVFTAKAAIFLPGRGYRFLQDAEHGSAIREYSIYLLQRF
jgi:hypothetical protein